MERNRYNPVRSTAAARPATLRQQNKFNNTTKSVLHPNKITLEMPVTKDKDILSTGNNSPKKESIRTTPAHNLRNTKECYVQKKTTSSIAADGIHTECILHGYMVESTICVGAYCKVKLAKVMSSTLTRFPDMAAHADNYGNVKVAIKVIEMKNVPGDYSNYCLHQQIDNHCSLPPHENVVRVFEHFRTKDRHYVVMEYCSQGDLEGLLNQRNKEGFKGLGEDKALNLFGMLAKGLQHIHSNGIVHRNLQCNHLLLDGAGNLKITDFGFSTRIIRGQASLLSTPCRSHAYIAPEMFKCLPYDGTKSDVWSMGIILFVMLNGRLPFNDTQLHNLDNRMVMQRLRFQKSISNESKVLARKILKYNPDNRPTMADILTDPRLTSKCPIQKQEWTTSYKPKSQHQPRPPQQPRPQYQSGCDNEVTARESFFFKRTLPERGLDSTVTINRDRNETVTLKSRTGYKGLQNHRSRDAAPVTTTQDVDEHQARRNQANQSASQAERIQDVRFQRVNHYESSDTDVTKGLLNKIGQKLITPQPIGLPKPASVTQKSRNYQKSSPHDRQSGDGLSKRPNSTVNQPSRPQIITMTQDLPCIIGKPVNTPKHSKPPKPAPVPLKYSLRTNSSTSNGRRNGDGISECPTYSMNRPSRPTIVIPTGIIYD